MGESMAAYRTALAFGLLLAPVGAAAQSLTGSFAFGDFTTDSGWYRTSSSGSAGFGARIAAGVALGGRATPGGPGLMNSEVLAQHFGLGAAPANMPGGTNFATSGARNANVNLPGDGLFLGAVPTNTQINTYLATYGAADRNALYLISSGGNDVADRSAATSPASSRFWARSGRTASSPTGRAQA
jgi:hypothetical protein